MSASRRLRHVALALTALSAGACSGGGGAAISGSGGAATSGSGGAGGIAIAGGTGGANASGAGGGSSTLPASDEFTGAVLDASWTIFNPSKVAVTVGGGALSLRAVGQSLWYQSNQGVLAWKPVTGDFKATTTVHTRKASDSSVPPDQAIELGGVMARNPSSAAENYVLIVDGLAEMGQIAIEHKQTTDGTSVFAESPFTADAELRICRVGASFTLWRRAVGGATWTMDYQVTRPDLPATLQVGPNLYANTDTADLVATFDRFTFAPVGAGCDQ